MADGHAHDVGQIRVHGQAALRARQSLVFHGTGIGTPDGPWRTWRDRSTGCGSVIRDGGSTEVYAEAGRSVPSPARLSGLGGVGRGVVRTTRSTGCSRTATRYANVLAGSVRGFNAAVARRPHRRRARGRRRHDRLRGTFVAPAADARPLDARDLERLIAILDASWAVFDAIAAAASGRELRRVRVAGRELDGIVDHVKGRRSHTWRSWPRPSHDGGTGPVGCRHGGASGRSRRAIRAVSEGLPENRAARRQIWLPATSFAAPRRTCSIMRGDR